MDSKEFFDLCKRIVVEYNDNEISTDDVYVVWSAKVLQNNKALLSTTVSDGMYYEVTLNGNKREVYLDAYKKQENMAIRI